MEYPESELTEPISASIQSSALTRIEGMSTPLTITQTEFGDLALINLLCVEIDTSGVSLAS